MVTGQVGTQFKSFFLIFFVTNLRIPGTRKETALHLLIAQTLFCLKIQFFWASLRNFSGASLTVTCSPSQIDGTSSTCPNRCPHETTGYTYKHEHALLYLTMHTRNTYVAARPLRTLKLVTVLFRVTKEKHLSIFLGMLAALYTLVVILFLERL